MKPIDEIQSYNWYGFKISIGNLSVEPLSNREKVAKELGFTRKDAVLIQFKAKDIEELKEMTEKLKSLKIKILREMEVVSYGTITNFLDPEGNILEILLEK